MDHLGERAAWQEHPNTIFMDSESDGEDAAEMPVFEATEGSEGGSGGPLADVVAGMESEGRSMMNRAEATRVSERRSRPLMSGMARLWRWQDRPPQ